MSSWLRFTQGVFSLWLLSACSLIAPSKDEISGGNAQVPGSGGGGNGGTGATGGSGGNAGATGGAAGSGGSAGSTGTLLWSDEFETNTGEWQFAGDQGWTLASGEALQTLPSASQPVRWVPSLTGYTDYRIEVSARRTSLSVGAIQILFRQTADSSFYYCSFHPAVGEMFWGKYSANWDSEEIGAPHSFSTQPYDADDQFTMTVTATGSHFACSVAEVAAAYMELDDTSYPAGAPGLKTYQLPAAYDYIRVYSK